MTHALRNKHCNSGTPCTGQVFLAFHTDHDLAWAAHLAAPPRSGRRRSCSACSGPTATTPRQTDPGRADRDPPTRMNLKMS
eukprot:2395183-Rhodomonas_salina.1